MNNWSADRDSISASIVNVRTNLPIDGSPAITQELYQSWPARAVADPRGATETQLKAGFLEIVATEGPVLAQRVLLAYAKAGGVSRVTQSYRPKLHRALQALIDSGELVATDELGQAAQDPGCYIVRTPEQPSVRVRTLGERSFDEIPPSEIAEIALQIRIDRELIGEEELTREILARYGLKRLTGLVKRHMDLVLEAYF